MAFYDMAASGSCCGVKRVNAPSIDVIGESESLNYLNGEVAGYTDAEKYS